MRPWPCFWKFQSGAAPSYPWSSSPGGPHYLLRFVVEKTKTVNIVATGGNALLLNLDEQDAA